MARWVFRGWIAGVGTSGGTRLVLGHWPVSPLGPFSDVMVAAPDGNRTLIAPSSAVADFVAATYRFDAVRLHPVQVATGTQWSVTAGPLDWRFAPGRRTALGGLLRAVPAGIGTSKTWARVTDPVARVAMRGVRTLGTAGQDRAEWYAARDLHRITASQATWDGQDLGALAPVDPPPGFGFSSTPRRPSLVQVTSTVTGAL